MDIGELGRNLGPGGLTLLIVYRDFMRPWILRRNTNHGAVAYSEKDLDLFRALEKIRIRLTRIETHLKIQGGEP